MTGHESLDEGRGQRRKMNQAKDLKIKKQSGSRKRYKVIVTHGFLLESPPRQWAGDLNKKKGFTP